jgi:hypothetical protein
MVLERGERHFPGFAGLLSHGAMIPGLARASDGLEKLGAA